MSSIREVHAGGWCASMVVALSNVVSAASNLLQTSFNQISQLWILTGLIAMFIIGLVIYICYSNSLGIPEPEAEAEERRVNRDG